MLGGFFVCVDHLVDLGNHRLPLSLQCYVIPIILDPDGAEVGAQEPAFHRVGGISVERPRRLQQVEVVRQGGTFLSEVGVARRETLRERGPLDAQFRNPLMHLGGGERPLSREVQQALLLCVQPVQFLLDPGSRLALGGEMLVCVAHRLLPQRIDHLRRELKALHFGVDGMLNEVDWEMRQVAGLVLSTRAEEILVDPATRIHGGGVDKRSAVSLRAAATASHHPAQEMVVHDIPLIALHAGVKHVLHPLEDLGRH
ncbi:MAG: hypothetical protein QM753_06075 [Thermomicrobiales bacterium]